jgi:Tfp pilus assembly protein PilO
MDIIYKIDPNIRMLMLPSFLIVVALGIFLFSVNIGYSQITNQVEKLRNIENQEQQLSKKLEILREVQEGLLEYSNASLMAVPNNNPTMWSLSLLRKSLYENELGLNKAEARLKKSENNLYNVSLDLELKGGLKDILVFASSTMKMAPIIKTKSMEVTKEEGDYTAKVELTTFWADLPKKLPALDEPIKGFEQKELEILVDVKKLLRPEFDVLEPQEDNERQSPFRE